MDEFLKMDIFFFVTTLVVVAVGILICLILWQIYRILAHVERFAEMAEKEGELIRQDIAQMRSDLRNHGFGWGMVWRLFGAMFRKSRDKKDIS